MLAAVTHVDREGSTHNLFTEYCVHHGLEGSGGIGESKEHYRGFEESLIGYECHFVLIFRCDLDHVVSPPNVDCGDYCSSASPSRSISWGISSRGYVSILDGPFVDWSVVLYRSQFTVLLFDEEEQHGIGALGSSYGASFQMFVDEFLEFFLFRC